MYINVKPEEMNTVASNIENKISEWHPGKRRCHEKRQRDLGNLWRHRHR